MTINPAFSQSNTDDSFSNLLEQEISLLESLQELMQEERKTIESNKIDNLDPITEQKKVLLDQVEQANHRRNEFLRANVQASSGRERLETFISKSQNKSQLTEQFNHLEMALHECKQQNDTNAMIVAMNQRHVERNLNIMKGIDQSAVTYTSKGTTNNAPSRLSGVKA